MDDRVPLGELLRALGLRGDLGEFLSWATPYGMAWERAVRECPEPRWCRWWYGRLLTVAEGMEQSSRLTVAAVARRAIERMQPSHAARARRVLGAVENAARVGVEFCKSDLGYYPTPTGDAAEDGASSILEYAVELTTLPCTSARHARLATEAAQRWAQVDSWSEAARASFAEWFGPTLVAAGEEFVRSTHLHPLAGDEAWTVDRARLLLAERDAVSCGVSCPAPARPWNCSGCRRASEAREELALGAESLAALTVELGEAMNGRTTPPTDAELGAAERLGLGFRVVYAEKASQDCVGPRMARALHEGAGEVGRWWVVGSDGAIRRWSELSGGLSDGGSTQ